MKQLSALVLGALIITSSNVYAGGTGGSNPAAAAPIVKSSGISQGFSRVSVNQLDTATFVSLFSADPDDSKNVAKTLFESLSGKSVKITKSNDSEERTGKHVACSKVDMEEGLIQYTCSIVLNAKGKAQKIKKPTADVLAE